MMHARRERGAATVVMLVGGAAALGWSIHLLCAWSVLGACIEALLVGLLLAQRSLYLHVAAVGFALERGGLLAGQRAVAHIVGRDPEQLDYHGVARAAIESLAENFSDGVVAPVFWYLLLGLPGLFAYKMANTLDSMIGHRSERYRAFGWAAARFDDVLNLIPARLSGLLLIGGAALTGFARPGTWFVRSCCAMRASTARRMRAGQRRQWPARSASRSPARAFTSRGPVHDAWLGDGNPQATPFEIGRALYLYTLACRLLGGLLFGVWVASQFMPPQ